MNLLVIIGNAAVDPEFRAQLLKDPIGTAQKYDLTLTKFEAYLLQEVFSSSHAGKLEPAFKALENALYESLPLQKGELVLSCPQRPCYWSIHLPKSR